MLKLVGILLFFWSQVEAAEFFEKYEYGIDAWNDREEDWEYSRIRDGWSWDTIEKFMVPGYRVHRPPEGFPIAVKEVRDFQNLHFDTLTNLNTNLAAGYPVEYNDLTRGILFMAESLVIKLDLYGDLRVSPHEWLMQSHFIPFGTPIPPSKIDHDDWILGPISLFMLAKQELFAKINFRREEFKLAQTDPAKLHVSQLITINTTSMSVLTRHFARYEHRKILPYSMPTFKLPEEMDVTMTPWDEIDGVEEQAWKKNLFQYPGPPSESDLFDLMTQKDKETFRNYGMKMTKSGWVANQLFREGLLKETQYLIKSWDFVGAKATAEFSGCACMDERWRPSRDPDESDKQMLHLLKECREELYFQWKKLAVAARLSSCFVQNPATAGKVYPDIPKHGEL